jgi:hypothetical protein
VDLRGLVVDSAKVCNLTRREVYRCFGFWVPSKMFKRSSSIKGPTEVFETPPKVKAKGGRPKGWRKVDDAQVVRRLAPFLQESSRYSLRSQQTVKELTSRLMQVYTQTMFDSGKAVLSYESLRKRLRGLKMGIATKLRERSDLCPICRCWDESARKEIQHMVGEAFSRLSDLDARYFDRFTFVFGPTKVDSPSWMTGWVNFVRAQHHLLDRAGHEAFAPVERSVLAAMEGTDGLLSTTLDYGWHFALREQTKTILDRDYNEPIANHVYIWVDFKERFGDEMLSVAELAVCVSCRGCGVGQRCVFLAFLLDCITNMLEQSGGHKALLSPNRAEVTRPCCLPTERRSQGLAASQQSGGHKVLLLFC